MRILAAFTLLTVVSAQAESTCNYVGLVKCFIAILDEWAWTLYELKENVVTINPTQCVHLADLDKCVKGDMPIPHTCTHKEIVEVSNTVSDLLTHRTGSGSFLKSYYLLTYACSPEGQEILNNHRECLLQEKIGEMTLSAGTYLSEKFLEHYEDDDVCEKVNAKLQDYIKAMSNICSKHDAAQLMCKSLKNMFKGLHPDKLDSCEFDCKIPEPEEENTVESSEVDAVQAEPDALGPQAQSASQFFPAALTTLIAVLVR